MSEGTVKNLTNNSKIDLSLLHLNFFDPEDQTSEVAKYARDGVLIWEAKSRK